MVFHKEQFNSFYVISDPIFVGQSCTYEHSTDIHPQILISCTNPSKCEGYGQIFELNTCSHSTVISNLPYGEYSLQYRVSSEDMWSSIPGYDGSIDVKMLLAIQPERIVAGDAETLSFTFSGRIC